MIWSACPVDVGCGNGKYLGHLKNAYQLGLDYSRNLLTFVQNKNLEAVRSDVMSIPLRDGVADACISIAVIHHLSTKVSTYIHILGVVTSKNMGKKRFQKWLFF